MWVVWRQQRSIVIAFLLLAMAAAVWTLITGLHEQSLWYQFLGAPCKGDTGITASSADFCEHLQFSVFNSGRLNDVVIGIGLGFAPLFGLILGANAVAREIEQKTHRLAWTQSASRARWLVNKYTACLLSLLVIVAPLCVLFSWWVGASHDAPRIAQKVFAISGIVEVACGVFCFALAVAIGLLVRRPGWTLAVGIVLFAAIFLSFTTEVLPNLGSPSVALLSSTQLAKGSSSGYYTSGGPPADSWRLSSGYEPTLARTVPSASLMNRLTGEMNKCESAGPTFTESRCAQRLGVSSVQLYIPANQFWTLQFYESGFYLAIAALLTGLSLLMVRRSEA